MSLRDAFLAVSSPPLESIDAGGDVLGLIQTLAGGLATYINSQKFDDSELSLIDKTIPNFDGAAADA